MPSFYSLLRPSSPLPTRSPHLPPKPLPTSLSTLLPLLRTRAFLSLSAIALSLFLFLSYALDLPLSTASRNPYSFPSRGLKKELWRDLDAIQSRSLVLEPVETPFVRPSTQDAFVPWSLAPLWPKSVAGRAASEEEKSSNWDSVPRHRIVVLPRTVLVPHSAPSPDRIMFGVVTTVERAKKMSALWTRWLVPFQEGREEARPACMVLLSAEEDELEVEDLREVLKARGLRCAVRTSPHKRYEVRVLSLVKEMRAYADEIQRSFDWFVFNDDDTLWLDLRTVLRMLGKYDSSEDYFVGATTEAKSQLEQFGRMAFGGAGMIVSDPLHRKIVDVWDTCYDKFKNLFGGDEMITRCAAIAKGATKSTVTTEERGMHQFDIPGDTTGVLQSGIPFLNLHHYMGGSWVHLFGYGSYRTDYSQITLLRRVLEFIGGDNLFKRYVFGDGKWLLTQGYSLTIFEEPIEQGDLALMEHTWYEGYELSFPDRPLVPERHDSTGLKVKQTFYIDDITVLSPKTAIMTYVQADKWDEHLSSHERVRIEVLWDGCWDGGEGCKDVL